MHRLYRGSLAIRVLAVSFLVLALPVFIYFTIYLKQSYDARLREVVAQLRILGKSRAALLSRVHGFSLDVIDIVSQLLTIGDEEHTLTSSELSRVMAAVAEHGHFYAIALIQQTPDKRYIATSSSYAPIIGMDFSNYHFIEEMDVYGETSWIGYGWTNFDKYYYVGKTVYDSHTGQSLGILIVATHVDTILERLEEQSATPYAVTASILDDKRILLASSNPDFVLRQVDLVEGGNWTDSDLKQRAMKEEKFGDLVIQLLPKEQGAAYLYWKGTVSIAVEVPVPGTKLLLIMSADRQEILAPILKKLRQVLLFFVVMILLGGFAAIWLTQRMSAPLRKLCQVMDKLSHGDLLARFKKQKMGFEINVIGEIFNQTIESLRDQVSRAEAERVQKETLKRELDIGQEIQRSILPLSRPLFPGVEIAARYLPATQVGGDFYDVFIKKTPKGEELVLTVADASGKGISACLYSLCLRSMLRSCCVAHDKVSVIMREANNLFCEDTEETGWFVTVFTAIFHPDTKRLTYTSCGHNPALLLRADGTVRSLSVQGMAMGVQHLEEIQEREVDLKSGDLVLLYTDGITEAHNPQSELFGISRLEEILRSLRGASSDEVVDEILRRVNSFRLSMPQHDDITLMAVKVL
jgi:sigma-B regulation protein RsbU (phosphoserine phosphatase)